jgi:hypothetical protein
MPNPSNPQDSDDDFSYGEGFAADVASDIGSSLFGKSEAASDVIDVETVEKPAAQPVLEDKPAAEAAPVATDHPNVVPGQNSESKPMPKSWKKDMEAHWSKLPPEVHEYVHTREAQVMRGIQQYQEGAQAWNTLIQPYAPIFQSQPDVQPVALMQGLMNTHLQLLNPSAPMEKKQAILQRLMSDYGVTLDGSAPPQANAEIAELRQTVQQLLRENQRTQEASFAQGVAEQEKAIEAFAADPKNLFFNEVANDILRFIKTGVATDLASAYDMACWVNPAVRAKRMAQQAAPSAQGKPAQRAANGQFVHLDSDSPPPARTRPGTMDSTIDSIVSKHFPSNAH